MSLDSVTKHLIDIRSVYKAETLRLQEVYFLIWSELVLVGE